LITTNWPLSGAPRANVTGFGVSEQRGNLNLNKRVIREMSV
jgi:hypothetical protein